MKTKKKTTGLGPGRQAVDGAVKVIRVNIGLTEWHHKKLKELAGTRGVSVWIRKKIEEADNGK